MKELDCVVNWCLEAFVNDPVEAALIAAVGLIAAVSVYFIWKKKSMRSKIRWSYPFASGILFLITYFSYSMKCHQAVPLCAEEAVMYSIPAAIIGSLIFGYVILPFAYLAWNRTRKANFGDIIPGKTSTYVADSGKPFAYSYGGLSRWIVVSQGMIDILTHKELQAVLLHEYGHLARNSSFYKTSQWIYSKMPVLMGFLNDNKLDDEEEREADRYAITAQGTERHLESAKRKIEGYYVQCDDCEKAA